MVVRIHGGHPLLNIIMTYIEHGYEFLPQLVSEPLCEKLLQTVFERMRLDRESLARWANGEPDEWFDRWTHEKPENVPGLSFNATPSPIITHYLFGMTALMERVTGKRLLPTYAYVRFYKLGQVMRQHTDRPQCEHSLSLMLSAEQPWSLETAGSPNPMVTGDAVAYRGNVLHGRSTPNPNNWSGHIFLHYVDANGDYSHLAFEP
jgi:hypothetical protein